MCGEAIHFCFLLVFLGAQPTLSVVQSVGEETRRNDSDQIELLSVTQSRAKFRISSYWRLSERIFRIVVRYRLTIVQFEPAALKWDSSAGCHVAHDARLKYDSGEVVHHRGGKPGRQNKADKKGDVQVIMSFEIRNLKFPGVEYEFEFDFYGEESKTFWKNARTLSSTSLPDPPKIGAGCFQVYKVYASSRQMRVFWQRTFDETRFEVIVYEVDDDGERSSMVIQDEGYLSRGYVWITIGFNRHHVILTSLSDAGRSATSSFVEIPAQQDILPAPPTIVNFNMEKGTFVMTWKVPTGMSDVCNYTVFIVDTSDRGSTLHIKDFVHLPGDENSFEVKGIDWVVLAVSVNTEIASSGLHIAQYSNS